MKNIIFLFIFCCKLLHAQHVFVKQWDWRYGGLGFDGLRTFIETTDKGFLFGVSTYSGLGGDKSQENWDLSYETVDYWIIKTDSNGIKQWDKRYGGRQSDYFRYLSQTRDGGYILGGFSNTDKNGDRTESCRGGVDYWIVKIDSLGNKQWDKRFGGTSDDELWEVKQTRDGGYILGGYSYSDTGGDRTQPSRGNQDYWIVKTDSIGNKQWDKRYGGGGSDLLNSLVQSNDGGFVLAGQSSCGIDSGYSTIGHGNMDYWVVKTDSIGNQIWDLSYGGTHFENLYTISKTNDGGYILGGISYSQNNGNKSESTKGNHDYWIVKIDSEGNIQWDKDFGGGIFEIVVGNIAQTTDNGFLISGVSRSNANGDKTENNLGKYQTWIVKTDVSGNLEWDKTLLTEGDNDYSFGGFVVQTSDHCFASANSGDAGIGGYKTQPNWDPNDSLYDIWIVKFCDTSLFTPVNMKLDIQNQLSIYPIPFFSDINIQLEKVKIKFVKISIKNILGKTVYFDLSNNTDKTFFKNIDLSFLSNGFYLLEMDFDGERIVRKLIKESFLIN